MLSLLHVLIVQLQRMHLYLQLDDMATGQSSRSPKWIKNNAVSTEVLRSEVASCKEQLTSSSVATQCEGARQLYQLIMSIWSMEAGQLSRDAADLVCDEIRC